MKTPEIKKPVVVPLGQEEWRLGLEVIWRRPVSYSSPGVCVYEEGAEGGACSAPNVGSSGYFIFIQVSK